MRRPTQVRREADDGLVTWAIHHEGQRLLSLPDWETAISLADEFARRKPQVLWGPTVIMNGRCRFNVHIIGASPLLELYIRADIQDRMTALGVSFE